MAKRNVQLTEETVGPGDARKVAITLGLMVMLVLLGNSAARWTLSEYTTNRGYWLIHQKWKMIDSGRPPVDWLVLGDSSCNQGVRPDVFDPIVGGMSLNACTIGDMLVVSDAWMLETYLARSGKPKGGVVLVHVYDEWNRPLSNTFKDPLLGRIPLGWGFWGRLTPPVALDTKQKQELFLSRYVPLYSENKTLADWIMSPRKPFGRGFYLDPQGYMPNQLANPEGVHKDAQGHLRFVQRRRFVISKVNEESLRKIRELADQQGFDVYIANSPLYEGLLESDEFRAYYSQVQHGIERYVASSPHLHYVLEDPVTFAEGEMENADHLTHAAAAVYSQKLAEAIQAARAP